MFSGPILNAAQPIAMNPFTSTNVGSANSTNLANPSAVPSMFQPFTAVILITVLHDIEGNNSNVSKILSQESGTTGLLILLCKDSSGASNDTYNCLGSSSKDSNLSGLKPLVTKNVVLKPLL